MVSTFNKTIRKRIFLHPADRLRKNATLKTTLLKDKRKYCHKLEGALLDVSSVKVVGARHLIVEGYSSMEVEADCCVFAPKPGNKLEGVINKVSKSHLGCLVLDVFNASLAIPRQQQLVPQIGDLVSFVVTEVVVDGDIIFMRGSLESIIKSAVVPERTSHIKKEPEGSPVKEGQSSTTPGADTSVDPTEEDMQLTQRVVSKVEPPSSDTDSPAKGKKKKKKKHVKDEDV